MGARCEVRLTNGNLETLLPTYSQILSGSDCTSQQLTGRGGGRIYWPHCTDKETEAQGHLANLSGRGFNPDTQLSSCRGGGEREASPAFISFLPRPFPLPTKQELRLGLTLLGSLSE